MCLEPSVLLYQCNMRALVNGTPCFVMKVIRFVKGERMKDLSSVIITIYGNEKSSCFFSEKLDFLSL